MITRFWNAASDRLAASDPGMVRLRIALSAVLGIAISIAVLAPLHQPITIILVAAIAAMMSAFTVNDTTPGKQAVTLLLALVVGAASLTAASLGSALPPLDSVLFVLLIFVAVYAQRFGTRGIALGSVAFFLFFFAMFLQTHLKQVPLLLLALVVGMASNALVRFVLLRRDEGAEFLRVRRAFRARLGGVVRVCEAYLTTYGNERTRKQLRTANARLHEVVLLIEDAAPDVIGASSAGKLRRRAIELELAVQWLTITVQRTCSEELTPEVREELIGRLRGFRSLIESDPRDLPVISKTDEFSKMLVDGSRIDHHAGPGDELRRAIADLALADVRAQRVADNDPDDLPEPDDEEDEEDEGTAAFAYDNQTRSAIQAVVGGGLAVLGGELVSHQRWYWAVLTVFVVFIGSSTAGATFVKGARRLGGTVVGIFGGVLLALLVGGNTPATLVLILVCVFGMVYMSRVSQVVMAFFVTSMLGLLYSLLGTFSIEVLGIRVAETAVGAASGILAASVIVPVRTRAVMLDDVADLLDELTEFLERAAELLSGSENVNIIELSRDLDRAVDKVRVTVEPLTHPINLSSARRDYGWHVLTTVETIAFRARHVAARAQPGLLADQQERLLLFTGRILRNIDIVRKAVQSPGASGHGTLVRDDGTPVSDRIEDPRTRSVISSLGHLDETLIALGRAFDVEATDPTQLVR
ncbi:FUSC family protein [Amycolatopsis sp. H20-H5]|uniref:FUSC family protein n=1 Tax=Amycolatopsis sp. H20-H5 TaxID=3046309 RepID=UPI002DBAA49B|nr:FUSC family protein [Amycolatopsis sp. H20-H5]MEC3976849.1 FUSC family protein [Amycolatopsis sp. H20-H5]